MDGPWMVQARLSKDTLTERGARPISMDGPWMVQAR